MRRAGKGGTGRYSTVDAKTKSEVDMTKIMGGLLDWTQKVKIYTRAALSY